MKNKIIALSLLLAGTCVSVNAQETENYYTKKWTNNIFVGAGVGAMTTLNDGMNPTFNFNITVGKYITPTWGVRGQVSGLWQKISEQETGYKGDTKTFAELNFDAMLNLTNLIGGYNAERAIDLYAFAGPTLNFAKAINTSLTINQNGVQETTYDAHGMKTRVGAPAGLGLAYNLNNKWALNLESRFGVTPSIFGAASECRKAEATGRLTIGATYTFGGKNFAKVSDRVIEKEVIKEVVKEVPVEVIKEVTKEVYAGATAVFFKIGKAKISPEGMVNIKLMAKAMKNTPNASYKIAGFADKATGSASFNQTLSEKRAQAVYDALVAEGVNPSQLEKVAMGGTDPMFEKAYLNRVVIMEVK